MTQNEERTPHRVIAAVRSEPWLIQPNWLTIIDEVAHRAGSENWRETLSADRSEHLADLQARASGPLKGARKAMMVDGIAVVPVLGPIFPRANLMTEMSGAASLSDIVGDIRVAAASPDVTGILLDVDSPGGLASGVAEAADAIRDAAAEKPMAAYVAGLGASAAYWLAAAAPRIVAHRTAQVGSIGVVAGIPVQEGTDRDGYRTIEVVSSNAEGKRPDPRTDEGRAAILERLNDMEAEFINDVASLRGVSTEMVRSDFGRGGVLMGRKAMAVGMIDEVGDFASALSILKGQASPGRGAGFQASTRENLMTTQNKADAAPASEETIAVSSISAATIRERFPGVAAELRQEGVTAERERQAKLSKLAEPGEEDVISQLRGSDVSVEDAAIRLAETRRERRQTALRDREEGAPKPVAAAEPTPPVANDAPKVDPDAPIEERAKAEWDADAKARVEFGNNFKSYLAFRRAEDAGHAKILRRA